MAEFAVAGGVDEVKFGLFAGGGVVFGTVLVGGGAGGSGELAEGCEGFLACVGRCCRSACELDVMSVLMRQKRRRRRDDIQE